MSQAERPLRRFLAPCPADGCDVDLAVIIKDAAADPIRIRIGESQSLSEAIAESASENAKARDAAIRAHLETHDVLDWLKTVRRLEQEAYNAGPTGVRPHAYGGEHDDC